MLGAHSGCWSSSSMALPTIRYRIGSIGKKGESLPRAQTMMTMRLSPTGSQSNDERQLGRRMIMVMMIIIFLLSPFLRLAWLEPSLANWSTLIRAQNWTQPRTKYRANILSRSERWRRRHCPAAERLAPDPGLFYSNHTDDELGLWLLWKNGVANTPVGHATATTTTPSGFQCGQKQ